MSNIFAERLSQLICPVGADVFIDDYWEARPLHVQRSDECFFKQLLSIDQLEELVVTDSLRHPDLRMVRDGNPVAKEQYVGQDGHLHAGRVWELFANGATVIADRLDRHVAALSNLCREMEIAFSAPFQTNIYLTPANAKGFAAHYDTHDVFILQVAGTKLWQLSDGDLRLPLRGQEHEGTASSAPGEKRQLRLFAGDTLYLPRGTNHEAVAGADPSLHITLGAHTYAWSDVMLEAMARLCVENVRYRKGLPPGFADATFDREEMRKIFRQLANEFATVATLDGALESLIDDFAVTRRPQFSGQLGHLLNLPALRAESVVAARPHLIFRITEEPDAVCITCQGRDIRMPTHARESALRALEGAPVKVAALPGDLDESGKVILVRRLVREGVLVIHEL